MKNILFAISLFAFAACGSNSDNASSSKPSAPASVPGAPQSAPEGQMAITSIESIKAAFEATEKGVKSRQFSKKTLAYTCEGGHEEGEVVLYSDERGLRKAVVNSAYEHGGYTKSYFFMNGQLYFSYVVGSYWTFHPNDTDRTCDHTTEERFYMVGGEVVRCLKKVFDECEGEESKPSAEVPNEEVPCDPARLKDLMDEVALVQAAYPLENLDGKCLYDLVGE